ncbi:MAG: AraC family transcriptional regulator [Flavobacteriaceae bacterium]
MSFKKHLFLCISALMCCSVYSQNFNKDSLYLKTYDELRELFFKYQSINETHNFERQPNDSIAEIFANLYLERAKKEHDTFHIVNGFEFKAYLTDFKNAILYCDSIIEYSKHLEHKNYPTYGYMAKGFFYYNNDNDDKATLEMLKARQFAIQKDNKEYLNYIDYFINNLNSEIGNTTGFKRFLDKEVKKITSIPNYREKNPKDYLITLDNLSKYYLEQRILDSAEIKINEGIDFSLKINESYMYSSFVLNSGTLLYFQEKYSKALDSLQKAEPMLTDNSLAMCYYYQGKVYQSKKNDKYVNYFKKIDSIYSLKKYAFKELSDAYRQLVDYYAGKSDTKNQLIYLEKLIEIDSSLNNRYNDINDQLVNRYEIPKLVAEKDALLKKIEKEKNIEILSLVIISSIAIISGLLYYKRQKKYKTLYNDLIKREGKNQFNETKQSNSNITLELAEDVINDLLSKLDSFEKKNKFLDCDITVNSLAKTFNSNSTYLSKVINFYKDTSFTNYLNSLRVNYVINELKINKTLRSYTIKAISKEVSFSNSESFSKAFVKKTGLKPSYYIRQLNK